MIVAGFAGVGKSTFAEMYPCSVFDFVAMPYKYYLKPITPDFDPEASKANYDDMREEWPDNYVEALKNFMYDATLISEDSGLSYKKIFLIPSDRLVLNMLRADGIPYTLVYPEYGAKDVYRQRYIDRGNTEDFLSVFIDGWDYFMTDLAADTYGQHIVLKSYEFLSDVLGGDGTARGK